MYPSNVTSYDQWWCREWRVAHHFIYQLANLFLVGLLSHRLVVLETAFFVSRPKFCGLGVDLGTRGLGLVIAGLDCNTAYLLPEMLKSRDQTGLETNISVSVLNVWPQIYGFTYLRAGQSLSSYSFHHTRRVPAPR